MNLYVIVQRTEIRSNLHHQNQVKYDKRHAMDKDCKNLNSCCKLELENIFISCFNNSSLHYWVTFEKNIFFSHPLVLSERKFLLSRENSTKSTAVSCFLWHSRQWYQISGTLHGILILVLTLAKEWCNNHILCKWTKKVSRMTSKIIYHSCNYSKYSFLLKR